MKLYPTDSFNPLEDVLDRELMATTTVLVLGCHTNTKILQILAKLGVRSFIICDDERVVERDVSASNIFSEFDVGKRKYENIKHTLLEKGIRIETYPEHFARIENFEILIKQADVIILLHHDRHYELAASAIASQHKKDVFAISIGTMAGLFQTNNNNREGCLTCIGYARKLFRDNISRMQQACTTCIEQGLELQNAVAAQLIAGVLHHRNKSSKPLAELGVQFMEAPYWIGQQILPFVPPLNFNLWGGADHYITPKDILPLSWACSHCGFKNDS